MGNKKLVLVPGATGKMGETFLHKFLRLKSYNVVGITSNPKNESKIIKASNLLNKKEVKDVVADLKTSSYSEIFLIHSIGPFVFEEHGIPFKDTNKNGIDDKTYELNFLTFKNIVEELIKAIGQKKILLTLVAFGSISDRYNVPWWGSYSKSKIILREFMRDSINKKVRGVFINVGSTEKEGERPFADKKYWLSCKEVVKKSMRSILDKNLFWQEIDIFKPSPDYHEGFFEDHASLKKRWIHDMYGKSITQSQQAAGYD